MDQDGTWCTGGPWSRPHCARWRPSSPSPKGDRAPNFRPLSIVAKRLNGSRWHLAWSWAWSRPHCAKWRPSSPPQKGGRAFQFSAHLYCGQTAGCIKMPLGMEVGLSRGDFVLYGDSAPFPKKGAEPPIFGPCLLWQNG